jgi:general stress protein 26
MLGLAGVDEGHAKPMTALLDGDRDGGPIWIFPPRTWKSSRRWPTGRAIGTFSPRGHDLFATIHGMLTVSQDRAVIDRLWSPFIAAWYDGGKSDPKLQLLRFDADRAQVWLNENSLLAGIKLMLGSDPRKEYKDKVAEVKLAS